MAPSLRQNPRKTPKALNAAASVSSKEEEQEQQSSNMLQQAPPKTLTSKTSSPLTSFVAARASAQKNHTITHDLLLKSTVSDGSHRKVGDGTNVKTTARAAGGILGGTVTPSKRPLKPPTAQGFMGNKRPKTTNNDESASSSSSRQNVEKKDAKTIANALQAALMKERIQSGRDLDENFGKNDPMALIAELQDVIMEETIQHRMALEEGTKRLTKMEQYKRRAHEAENKLKVKTEEANQARDDLEQMKQDLATVLDENGEMERRLSGIVAMATGEQQPQQQQQQEQLEEERVQEVAVAVTPTLKKEPRARWHSDEMMNLYRLCHSIGSNDWEKIVATGEIPSKTGQQMSSKWSDARKCKKYNPLEKAFSDAKAQVAKQIGDVKVVGTVVDYVLDEKSREGTWTIVWGDGTAEEITKDKLLSSLNLYDEMKKEAKHDERE